MRSAVTRLQGICVSSYYYSCVLVLLYLSPSPLLLYPHTAIYVSSTAISVSSYCYISLLYCYICVLILLRMCAQCKVVKLKTFFFFFLGAALRHSELAQLIARRADFFSLIFFVSEFCGFLPLLAALIAQIWLCRCVRDFFCFVTACVFLR